MTNVNESGQVDILYYDTHKSGAISNVNVSKLKLDENKRLTKRPGMLCKMFCKLDTFELKLVHIVLSNCIQLKFTENS